MHGTRQTCSAASAQTHTSAAAPRTRSRSQKALTLYSFFLCTDFSF